MQWVDLYDYCLSDAFFWSIKDSYDVVVTDITLSDDSVPAGLRVCRLGSFWYDFSVDGELASFLQASQSVLLLLKDIASIYLVPWLQHYRAQAWRKLTIVNMGVGVSSCLSKQEADVMDVYHIYPYLPVFEPVSLQQFDAIVATDLSCYIRVMQQPVLETHSDYLDDSGIFSFTWLWYEGNDMTLVLWGQYIHYAQSLYEGCQSQWLSADVFALSHYQSFLAGELLGSAKRSGRLVYVLDHDAVGLSSLLKEALFNSGLSDTGLHIITPLYDDITSLLYEYIHEEAMFGVEWLVGRISSALGN